MLKNLMKNERKSKGFTLIELIIVIAIIAILAAIAVPKYLQVRENSRVNADVSSAETIRNAALSLYTDETIKLSGKTAAAPLEIKNTAAPATTDDTEANAVYETVDRHGRGDLLATAKDAIGGHFYVYYDAATDDVVVSVKKGATYIPLAPTYVKGSYK